MEFTEMFTTFLISTITGISTFWFGIKRGKSEIEASTLQNIEKSVGIYQVIIDDMRDEINLLNNKISTLEGKVNELLNENTELKKMVEKCSKVKE